MNERGHDERSRSSVWVDVVELVALGLGVGAALGLTFYAGVALALWAGTS